MQCDVGRLRAYLDGGLTLEEQAEVAAHLERCAACRAEFQRLQGVAAQVQRRLEMLQGEAGRTPDPALALQRFHTRVRLSSDSSWTRSERRIQMAKSNFRSGGWRALAVGVITLALLVGLFSLAPVREAAAQFLGVFRVRKFAVIPVNMAQLSKLESLEGFIESGVIGEPMMVREPGQPQTVADAAAASALAGFRVRLPQETFTGATARDLSVTSGPAVRMQVDRATMEAAMQMLGVQGVKLPAVDPVVVDVDVPNIVERTYVNGRSRMSVTQLPSPTVTVPPGLDPALMGEALLQAIGMPADEARRVARTIDWTSTLVVPLPTNIASFREIAVDGVSGLFIEQTQQGPDRGPASVVLWQRDGILYTVQGANVSDEQMLRAANSLK